MRHLILAPESREHGRRRGDSAAGRSSPAVAAVPREIQGVQELGGGAFLVQLAGIEDRDAAEGHKGCAVLAARVELPPLADDEIYLSDVIGCTAVGPDGAVLGTVSATPSLSGLDYLELGLGDGGKVLIPWVPEIVTALDLAQRQVTLDPPEGLLELADSSSAPAATGSRARRA